MSSLFSMEVTPDDNWGRAGDLAQFAVSRTMELTSLDLWGNMRAESPVRTGRFAGAWEVEKQDDTHWIVFNNVEYGPFVAFGTLPHVIMPRNARALRFVIDNNVIYAARVQHPGQPANLFWQYAIRASSARVPEFARIAISEFT